MVAQPEPTEGHPVLLYDGLCAFCDWTVRWVIRADRHAVFRFAALQGALAAGVRARHPRLEAIDSLVLVEGDHVGPDQTASPERVSVRSGAVLRIAALLGGPWKVLLLLRVVPRPVRDWAYDIFARNRYRLFARYDECALPPPEVRDRFLT